MHPLRAVRSKLDDTLGGAGKLPTVAVLAGVLALDTADKGTVSAVAGQLKSAFGIGNTEIGLLLAVVSFAGAAATIPFGIQVDRTRRKTVLMVTILLWTVAMGVSGVATSYLFLLVTRVALGAVTASAWPAVASLTGDFFPAQKRAGVYGLVLGGELLGLGVGFFVSGEVSSFGSWRWGFFAMAAFSLCLAGVVKWLLPEPGRGSQHWLSMEPSAAQKVARQSRIQPRQELILHQDPTGRSWWWSLRYCFRIPSYGLLVAASALAYYFFSGTRAFAMIYFTEHYNLAKSSVSALVFILGVGALVGVAGGGQLSEWLLRRGRLNARVTLPAVTLIASVPLLGFGIWTTQVWVGIALLTLGGATMAAGVPSIDAARLDIMHPRLWGRAESGRMAVRLLFEGSAPLLFGALSGWLGGGDRGLMWTFLLMLAPMVAASLFVLPGRKTYPRDVVTAAASVKEARGKATPGSG